MKSAQLQARASATPAANDTAPLDGMPPAQTASLLLGPDARAIKAAAVIVTLGEASPESLVPALDSLVRAVPSSNAKVAAAAAGALVAMVKVVPARVAKHLDTLIGMFPQASDTGRDGLIRVYIALCSASIAYQKRVDEVIQGALATAEPKTMQRWTDIVLPVLKGEPHANARHVLEQRLYDPAFPRPAAQKLAATLGLKLRPRLS